MSSKKTFSQYLLDKYDKDFVSATQHPFLEAAGNGSLDKNVLEAWLRQDYQYAYVGYIKFASLLISRLPYPTLPPPSSAPAREHVLHKALSTLIFSLANVKRETGFFVATAEKYGLRLVIDGALPNAETPSESVLGSGEGSALLGSYDGVTRAYVDYLHAVAATGSVEEGAVVLWAMEKAYLTAWNYAKSHQQKATPSPSQTQTQTQEALEEFIDNWTNDEFVGFVDDCEELVDGLVELDSPLAARCEEAFKRILWLEQRFWPAV